jgi:hypothetical protein
VVEHVIVVSVRFVSNCVTVTATPGAAAPLGSVTVPVIAPVNDCAPADEHANSTATPMLANKTLDWFLLWVIVASPELADPAPEKR